MNKSLQVVFFCVVALAVAHAAPGYLGYPYGAYANVAPLPVGDTPEVSAAKAAHYAAYNQAAAAAAASPDYDAVHVGAPVYAAYAAPSHAAYAAHGHYVGPLAGVPAIVNGVPADTPEVAAAKVAHFAAHAQVNGQYYG